MLRIAASEAPPFNGYDLRAGLAVGRLARAALVLCLAGALLALLSAAVGQVVFAHSPQLVFNSRRDGNVEIYLLDERTGAAYNLTHHPADDFGPDWSPDGQHIIFYSARDGGTDLDLFVMDALGRNVQQITHGEHDEVTPSWSPDGTRIAYTSDADGDLDIYVMPAEGGEGQNLTLDDFDNLGPDWAPSGDQIVFNRYSPRGRTSVFVIAYLPGVDPALLPEYEVVAGQESRGYPRWLPDGGSFALTRAGPTDRGRTEVWQTSLTGDPLLPLFGQQVSVTYTPDWSTDGTRLAVTAIYGGTAAIYVADGDGRNLHMIYNSIRGDWSPVWRP